jgi:hypothetical protein
MGVRLARIDDIPAALEVGRRVLDRSVIDAKLYDLQAKQLMRRCINDAHMNLWVAEHAGNIVGFFMGIKEQHWFSREKYASDISFCVDDRYGNYAPAMIRRFIKWAKQDPKVKDITLAISSGLDKDGRTGRMYQNLGLTHTGGVYALLSEKKNVITS